MNDFSKTKTDRYRKQISGYQRGERRGEGKDRVIRLRDANYYEKNR